MEVPRCDSSCPRCWLEPETFSHPILFCPSRQGGRSHLLHGVTSVGQDAPLWICLPLLKRLATFIGATSTAFPPMIFPPNTSPLSPPIPLSPLAVPHPGVSCFFVGCGVRPVRFSFLQNSMLHFLSKTACSWFVLSCSMRPAAQRSRNLRVSGYPLLP